MATKPEQKMWDYISDKMRGRWNAQRHEDELSNSVPDVSYGIRGRDGWIELKTIEAWPKRESTKINLPHLRPGQVNWIEDRARNGNGRCWLLLMVGATPGDAEWLLFPPDHVRAVYNRAWNREQMLGNCLHCRSSASLEHFLMANL
jgi:hypothetical protein